VAGQRREQFGGDGAEEPLPLAAPTRLAGRGMDELDLQVGANLGHVGAGEVGAMIAVQGGWYPAHRPIRVGLAPNRLPQGQVIARLVAEGLL